MKKTIKPILSKDEKQILSNIETGKFASVPKLKQEVRRHAMVAKNTLAKNKTISIRISEADLIKLKEKAAQEGMPYQTLISASLHRLTKQ